MPLLILIDGLETPSVATPDSGDGVLPVLARLAATGQTGRLRFANTRPSPEEGEPYFELFGALPHAQLPPEHDLPSGYAVAAALLGDRGGAGPDPQQTWCCLGFTHLYRKQNDLLILSPERTGQTLAECWPLLEAVLPEFQEEGWTVPHQLRDNDSAWDHFPAIVPLCRAPSVENPVVVRTKSLTCVAGQSLRVSQPVGPYANTLLRLITGGQLALARHPLNLERQRLGRVTLNTPWLWGIGSGTGIHPNHPFDHSKQWPAPTSHSHEQNTLEVFKGHCWTAHPLVAGLARTGGYRVVTLDETKNLTPLVAAARNALTTGAVLIHLQLPAVLARHGLLEERRLFLQRVNAQLLDPLAQAMASIPTKQQEHLVITSAYSLAGDGRGTDQAVPWVAALGDRLVRRQRFWQRGTLGHGNSLSPDRFRALFWPVECGRAPRRPTNPPP